MATNKDFLVKNGLDVGTNAVIGGELHGPATFVIDPAAIGDNTGTVQIKGNLVVDGTVNADTLDGLDSTAFDLAGSAVALAIALG